MNTSEEYGGKLKTIGRNCSIAKTVYIEQPELVVLGDNVQLMQGVYLQPSGHHIRIGPDSHCAPYCVLYGPLTIGSQCAIAAHVVCAGVGHTYSNVDEPFISGAIAKEIIIEDNVWIGANAVIIQGVRVGAGSIIGAGAVVTRNVEPYSVVCGVPGRVVRNRRAESQKI